MAVGHVYHWKHGWIPLTYFAALQKAHGSRNGAISYLHASNGIHGSESIGAYRSGIHTSEAAQSTSQRLMREGLGLGSGVFWKHPGTGRQTSGTIVGIEHTGHIIIQHSGNRNALIGHSTYSKTAFPNTPFDPRFHNPHVHTRVLEQDHGVPMAPPGHPHGRFPRQTHSHNYGPTGQRHAPPSPQPNTQPRINSKPDLTPSPTITSTLPHEFTQMDPRTMNVGHFVTTASRNFEASKVRQAYSLGHHKVLIQAGLTKEQTQGLLHDIKETLHTAHPTVKDHPVTFLVPTNDRHFRARRSGATVLGYVVRGGSTVHINPRVANGTYEQVGGTESFMPARKGASLRRYVMTHELGHVVEHIAGSDAAHDNSAGVHLFRQEMAKGTHDNGGSLSTYAASSLTESYAEMFAQHQLGGKHHGAAHTVAEKYGQIYGWQKPAKSKADEFLSRMQRKRSS